MLGALSAEVLERETLSPELAVMLWLHLHSPAWLVALSQGFHVLGSPLVMWPALLWLRRRQPQAMFAGLALWGATGVQWGLKQLFERARPDLWPRSVPEHGYAFPSGHTTVAAALALVLMVLAWHTPQRWLVVTVGVPVATDATVLLLDPLGRQVSVLYDGPLSAGRHGFHVDASSLRSGVYVVRVMAGAASATARLIAQ